MSDQPVNLIDQRVIEANALVPAIRAFGEKIGLEGAKAVVQKTHENASRAYGRICAEEMGSNTLADLAEVVSSWAKGGGEGLRDGLPLHVGPAAENGKTAGQTAADSLQGRGCPDSPP